MKKDYEIGYCKPPVAKQFKKGRSGNPNGRPKKGLHEHRAQRTHIKDDILRVLQRRMNITEEGRTREITIQRALIKAEVDRAIQGHSASIAKLWDLFKHYHLDRKPDPNVSFSRLTPAREKRLYQWINDETPAPGTEKLTDTSWDEDDKQYRPERAHIMDDLLLELQQDITISDCGKPKKISKQQALLLSLVTQSMKGDSRAWKLFWAMFKHYELDQEPDKYLISFSFDGTHDELKKKMEREALQLYGKGAESAEVPIEETDLMPELLPPQG